jgi:hypothetical protein
MKSARERIAEEGLFQLKKTPGVGLCCVVGCRQEASSRKKKIDDLWFCHSHWQGRWRALNPKRSAYSNLRDNARKRRIKFSLTYDYFCGFMDAAAGAFKGAETRGEIVTVDRIDASKGYAPGNVQLLTLSENSAKSNKERYLPAVVQDVLRRKREKLAKRLEPAICGEDDERCPF